MKQPLRDFYTARLWPQVAGPVLGLGVAGVMESLSRGPFNIPNPPAVLLLIVVFSAFIGGLRAGIATALIAWLYFAHFFSIPGQPLQYTPDNLRRVIVWALTTPAMAIMVGMLKHRSDRAFEISKENAVLTTQIAERRGTAQAEADLQRLAAIVESSDDAIISKTLDGIILSWNIAAERMYGYRAGEAIGRPISLLIPANRPDEMSNILDRLKRGESIEHFETVRVRKDGAQIDVSLTVSPIRGPTGRIIAASTIARDITLRKHSEREIRALNKELEDRVRQRTAELQAANRELEAFAYTVAHDLRSPLITIGGFSQMLLEDHAASLPEDARRLIDQVATSSRHMNDLIDDLLAFSRLGRHPLKEQPVDLADIARQALAELNGGGANQRACVRIGDLPPCRADPALLKQVLVNLLSNALKYSRHRDEAVIEVGWRRDLDDAMHHAYFVKDNGAGFDMRYADKLFRVFQRLHRADEYEGTGVGLAIVQRIIHRHGGKVWADAEVERGATFFFTLARRDAA